MKHALASVIALVLGLVAACGNGSPLSPGGQSCTAIGCENGVRFDFSFNKQGSYVFDINVDGVVTTCRATLPLSPNVSSACDRPDVLLTLSGSALPEAQQSIGGLLFTSTTAKTISIRATRDGALIGEKTFAVNYIVSPGPNGPDCEPKECKQVSTTFP